MLTCRVKPLWIWVSKDRRTNLSYASYTLEMKRNAWSSWEYGWRGRQRFERSHGTPRVFDGSASRLHRMLWQETPAVVEHNNEVPKESRHNSEEVANISLLLLLPNVCVDTKYNYMPVLKTSLDTCMRFRCYFATCFSPGYRVVCTDVFSLLCFVSLCLDFRKS